ncbi:MAG: methyltransferase domain-containing protein [Planctomycetes bacterium]|nr:methyltransferase domain-containing protein [Planctomycetota bacterium]
MPFDLVAAAYDVLSDPEKRLKREGEFLKTLSGKDAAVLDLACGTGAHAEYLARWGAKVIACDLSEKMIARASSRCGSSGISYQVRDMRTPPEGVFDFVYCIGNSINLLPSLDDVVKTFAAVKERLAPDGRFLLHAINPESPAHANPTIIEKSGVVDGVEVSVLKRMTPDPKGRVIDVEVTWADDSGNHSGSSRSVLLDLTHKQMETMLRDCGFASLEWFGGLDGTAFVPGGSPDLVVVAR